MADKPGRTLTIGDELFMLVERLQGEAFIADDMEDWDTERVIRRAEVVLDIQREINRRLVSWIRHKRKEATDASR